MTRSKKSEIDLAHMMPGETIRMLTTGGCKITVYQLSRLRDKAGYNIGDKSTIHYFKLFSWSKKHYNDLPVKQSMYEIVKQRAAERQRITSLIGRDIGPLPEVANTERRAACERSFKSFCEIYLHQTFNLPWSKDHDKVIYRIEIVVLDGGQFAIAMPRGDGKTSLCEAACVWALCYAHRKFIALIGASETHGYELLGSIKIEFEYNELLLEDFPEICYPVHRLDGIAHRSSGQLLDGKHTSISWTEKEIILPTVEGSAASGSIIKVGGITGRIRGMKHKTADGLSIRPDLVIVDDPQTDESAHSTSQCMTRERVLKGTILGLVAPTRKMACIMPCTVIAPGDLADTILDTERNPDWNGIRTKMVYEFPTNAKLWEEYADLRARSLREFNNIKTATEFYRQNREAMDEGAVVSWTERYEPDELSALQHAMNLKLKDEFAFFSERQNDPLPTIDADAMEILSGEQIMDKINNLARAEIPASVNHLTLFIDPHEKLLYWAVMGFEENFTTYLIDYGTFPRQNKYFFNMRDVNYTLRTIQPNAGLEAAIFSALDTLVNEKMSHEYIRDDGAVMKIRLCLIDASWGQTTNLIYTFCRQSQYSSNLMPSHGKYFGASSRPLAEYQRKRGDRVGDNWKIPSIIATRTVAPNRMIRHVIYDTNYWKSFVFMRLATKMGDPGCMSLFGNRRDLHRMYVMHMKAEYCVRTEAAGRVVHEWRSYPAKEDNHLFDCTVGCCVGASIEGVSLRGGPLIGTAPRQKVRYSEMQRQKRSQRSKDELKSMAIH